MKYPINIDKADITKILISSKVSYGKKGFKYFTAYKNGEKNKPLCIKPLKLSRYAKYFEGIKNLLIKNGELLEVCKKIQSILYNTEYLKTKIKLMLVKQIQMFMKVIYQNKVYAVFPITLIDSAFKKDKNYQQIFIRGLQEFKFVVKEKKTSNFIDEDIDVSSDVSDEEISDKEHFYKELIETYDY